MPGHYQDGRVGAASCSACTVGKYYNGTGANSSALCHSCSVWDADTHAHVATLEGHTSSVHCLTIYKNKLFSGSWDSTIRVWNLDESNQAVRLSGVFMQNPGQILQCMSRFCVNVV